MISSDALKSYSHKDLAQMAKRGGIAGWHAMRKDQLVKAIVSVARTKHNGKDAPNTNSVSAKNGSPKKSLDTKPTPPRVLRHLERIKAKLAFSKSLATAKLSHNGNGACNGHADRVVVMVKDPYWLHIYWEITAAAVERASVAMAQDWHLAKPILRLLEIHDGASTTTSEQIMSDTEIHGGLNSWYLHVEGRTTSYRAEIGYLSAAGRFFPISRSNVVTTPLPGSSEAVDSHWADVAANPDKVFAMSGGYSQDGTGRFELHEILEERLRRPIGSPMVTRFGAGIDGMCDEIGELPLEIEAEMIVYGETLPGSHVTLKGEPVKLESNGTFAVRMPLPNQRQVIPAVVCAANGALQRTVIIAVERNTKSLELIPRESAEL